MKYTQKPAEKPGAMVLEELKEQENRMNEKQINSIIWLIDKRIEEIKKLLNLRSGHL